MDALAQLGVVVAGASVLQAGVGVEPLSDPAFGVGGGVGDGDRAQRHSTIGQVKPPLIRHPRRTGDLAHRPLRIAVQVAGVGGQHAVEEFHRRVRIGQERPFPASLKSPKPNDAYYLEFTFWYLFR